MEDTGFNMRDEVRPDSSRYPRRRSLLLTTIDR